MRASRTSPLFLPRASKRPRMTHHELVRLRNAARTPARQGTARTVRCRHHSAKRACWAAAAVEESEPARQTSERPLRVMIAGAPAAGKGTQCAKIVEKYGLVHVSAGDLLRAEVEAGTPAGARAKSFMDSGNLVPNDVVVEMVVGRLQQADAQTHGWLLDGYPRSGEQAEAIEAAGIRPDVFILINVPDDELVERVVGRRLDPETGDIYHLTYKQPPPEIAARCVQRSDDTEDKLRTRLDGHHRNVQAVVGYYADELVEVDGSRPMAEVAAAIEEILAGSEQQVVAQAR